MGSSAKAVYTAAHIALMYAYEGRYTSTRCIVLTGLEIEYQKEL